MKARVLTALALMPIVLGAFFLDNPWPLAILASVAAYLCGREIASMLGRPSHAAGALSAVLVLAAVLNKDRDVEFVAICLLFLVGVVAAYIAARTKSSLAVPFSLFWAIAPLAAILKLTGYYTPNSDSLFVWQVPALMAIVPLWGGDTAAIFAGKAFGKHPLAPAISPKKTWEGAIANLVACLLVAWGLGALMGFSTAISLACGVAAGTLGQAGDLFESYVKRQAGLKDSGTLLPGHGGLMDRIDSILFTAPAVAMIFWFASRA